MLLAANRRTRFTRGGGTAGLGDGTLGEVGGALSRSVTSLMDQAYTRLLYSCNVPCVNHVMLCLHRDVGLIWNPSKHSNVKLMALWALGPNHEPPPIGFNLHWFWRVMK